MKQTTLKDQLWTGATCLVMLAGAANYSSKVVEDHIAGNYVSGRVYASENLLQYMDQKNEKFLGDQHAKANDLRNTLRKLNPRGYKA